MKLWCHALIMLGMAVLAGTAAAQEVGTVATLEGSAEIGRANNWTPAALGSPIVLRDVVRTGSPGRIAIVFQDDTVMSLSDNSELTIDEQVFDPSRGPARSVMELVRGKVNALVGEYYHQAGAAFEVQSGTAVAGVRGTEFSMAWDPDLGSTEVIGISGVVEVHSIFDPTGPGVLVRESEMTTVAEGQRPSAPRRLQEIMFRQHLEGIHFVGGGKAESLLARSAVRTGAAVPAPEHAPLRGITAPPGQSGREHHDASGLIGQSPDIVRATTGKLGIAFPR